MRRNLLHVIAAVVLSSCSGPDDPPVISDGEPNDTLAQATPLASGVPFVGTMSSYADVDFYRIDVPGTGAMVRIQTFDASGVTCSGVDTYLELYNSYGSYIGWDNNSGLGLCEDNYTWYPPGSYYVAVTPNYPASFAYTIRITITATSTTSEIEPNNYVATANGPYVAGSVVVGSISPIADVDYFAIQNTSGLSVTFQMDVWNSSIGACSSLNGDPTLTLYDSYGTYLTWVDDYTGLCPRIVWTIPAYATYFAAVRELGNNSTIPYYLLDISAW